MLQKSILLTLLCITASLKPTYCAKPGKHSKDTWQAKRKISIKLPVTVGLIVVGVLGYYLWKSFSDKEQLLEVSAEDLSMQKLSDEEILTDLKKQKFADPIDVPGDNRCLFHCISPHVTEDNLQKLAKGKITWQEWKNKTAEEQADHLRAWALEKEEQMLDELETRSDKPDKIETLFIKVLYQDMLEELNGSKKREVNRKAVQTVLWEKKYDWCIKNFKEYKDKTIQPSNFSGTPEALALSLMLDKGLVFYGNDYAWSKEVPTLENQLLPYFAYIPNQKPSIAIFQCRGGGHYMRLKLPADWSWTYPAVFCQGAFYK